MISLFLDRLFLGSCYRETGLASSVASSVATPVRKGSTVAA